MSTTLTSLEGPFAVYSFFPSRVRAIPQGRCPTLTEPTTCWWPDRSRAPYPRARSRRRPCCHRVRSARPWAWHPGAAGWWPAPIVGNVDDRDRAADFGGGVGSLAIRCEGHISGPAIDLDPRFSGTGMSVQHPDRGVALGRHVHQLTIGADPNALGFGSHLNRRVDRAFSSGHQRCRPGILIGDVQPRCHRGRYRTVPDRSRRADIRRTRRAATSTSAMPSLVLSALSFSHSASGILGGHFGDPLSAT